MSYYYLDEKAASKGQEPTISAVALKSDLLA